MIHESAPWKAVLAADARLLERWATKPPSERRSYLIERKILLAAYALRKLGEAFKLSTLTLTDEIAVKQYAPLKRGYTEINNLRFEEYFDLENPTSIRMKRRRLIDVLIHSLIFMESIDDEQRCTGFIVTSDHESARGLIEVQLSDFIALMRLAADDFPSAMTTSFNATKRKWIVWTGHDPELSKKIAELVSPTPSRSFDR